MDGASGGQVDKDRNFELFVMQQLKITTTKDDQWFALEFGYNRRFSDLIRDGIKPLRYRRWVKVKNHWQVHKNKLPLAVHFGRRLFHHVDYSALPESLQIWIVEQMDNGGWSAEPPVPLENQTPHQVLHLLPTAPQAVIKAAYKALASLYHPDHGGDPDAFRAVHRAYEELSK